MTIYPKITLQLVVSSKKFFMQLHNKYAIVHKGSGYPSRHTLIGVIILEQAH